MKKTFIKKSFLTILATIFGVATSFGQATITTGVLSPTEVCAGSEVSVAYATTGVTAPLTNFIAELSDATGSFAAAVEVGSATSTPITATIPAGIVGGAGYKIRVVSKLVAATVTTGSETGIKINSRPPAPTLPPLSYCVGQSPALIPPIEGSNIRWYLASDPSVETSPITSVGTSTSRSAAVPFALITQTVDGCQSGAFQITLGIYNPAAKPTITNPSPVCQNVDLSPNILSDGVEMNFVGGQYKNDPAGLVWYTNQSGAGRSTATPTPTTTVSGDFNYFVSVISVYGCESPIETLTLKVKEATAKPKVSNQTFTQGQQASVLKAEGAGLKWYDSASSNNALSGAPIPPTTTPGSRSYFVSQTLDGCESERAEIVVTISNCTPAAKPSVSPVTYEIGAKAEPLKASGVAGATFKWYDTASGGVALAGSPTPLTGNAGTKSYFVSQTKNNCESERAEIVVTVTACTPPAAPKVEDIAFCINGATTALAATGTGLKWYSASTGGTGSATAPKPASTTEGVTSFYVSQTVGGCESPRAEIKVTINKTDAPAVEDLDYCLNATASTLTATGTALKWYTAATGGTGSASAPTPTTNAIGTKSYYVTQTLNGCESARSEIKVTIKNLSTQPTVTALVNLCQSSTATALTATGTALKWYSAATGGSALASAPIPVTTATGTTSYYVSQTAAGLCEGPRAKIDVVIKDTPLAPTVAEVNYCVGEKPVALTPSGGTYKWYTALTGGTGSATPPAVTTTTAGTTSYYLTQSNTYGTLSCESLRAKKDVIVNATPATLPIISDSVCQERGAKSYTFGSKASDGNTLNWYAAATGGTATKTVSAVDLTKDGTTTYYVTQLTAKNCESAARTIQRVRVKPLPVKPTIPAETIEICQLVVAPPLTATPVTNGILNWYKTNDAGENPSATAPTPSTAEGGTTSFYVGQTLEGCISDRAKIDVKINTTPKPTTTTRLAYCQNETAPVLDATGSVLKWYREADGIEWQGVPFTPFTEKVQDYSFYVTQTGTNGCESPKEEIKIHIKSLPSATLSGNSTIDLGQTATINIKFTGDGPWIYALSSGETDTTDQANHQVQVKPITTTSYLMTEVSNACGKGLPIGSAVVTVKIPTINSGNPSVAEACAGKTFNVPFQQSGDFPAGNTFKLQISQVNEDAKFWTVPSVASNNSITATFPDTTKGGSYFLRVISSGENPDFTVIGSVSSITITASPLPVATLTGTQTILIGESADLKAEITGKSPWTLTVSNGVKDTLITATNTPYTFKVAPKVTSTYTITKATNGCGTGRGAGSARVQVDPILGVEPPAAADWVKIYPTLIDSKFTVEITGVVSPKEANVEVIDLNGRSRSIKKISQKVTDVEFGNYPSGLYLIRIQNGNLNTVQRVMKP
jgi:hypothetical protein